MRPPRYAEVTSTLALFIALGGVSWAATTLPKNAVTSAAIKDGQVRNPDLASGSVSAKKLSKALRGQLGVTIGTKDGGAGSAGSNGNKGADGPAGAAGAAGAAGRDGAALVATGNFGSHQVAGKSFVKIGELVWNQPAGALDDIRGLYTIGKTCSLTDPTIPYRLLVDGIEVSYDRGNTGPDTAQTGSGIDPDPVLIPMSYVGDPSSDRGTFGAELPILGGAAGGTHTLEMFLRNDTGCGGAVPVSDIQLFVTRFSAG